jgi:NAD-dependent dihydropyrimidine dehydrogenase PreA subunit
VKREGKEKKGIESGYPIYPAEQYEKKDHSHRREEKCNGCGQCIPDCPEVALQAIEEKPFW